jgi:hypothetical protein
MLTPSNIYRIDFEENYCGVKIPHTIIFNITQISEDDVYDLINYGIWEDCDKIVELRQNQLKYLEDKENQ